MTTFVKVNEVSQETINSAKVAPQCKILATWLTLNKVDEKVNQQDLLLELNSHQMTNEIFNYTPKNPISAIYQFYRRDLINLGVIEIEKITKENGESSKKKALEDRIKLLESKLSELGIEI